MSANRIGRQIQLVVSCLRNIIVCCLTPMDQVRNDLLSRISRLRVPPEFGAAKVSCWKMDEVGRANIP